MMPSGWKSSFKRYIIAKRVASFHNESDVVTGSDEETLNIIDSSADVVILDQSLRLYTSVQSFLTQISVERSHCIPVPSAFGLRHRWTRCALTASSTAGNIRPSRISKLKWNINYCKHWSVLIVLYKNNNSFGFFAEHHFISCQLTIFRQQEFMLLFTTYSLSNQELFLMSLWLLCRKSLFSREPPWTSPFSCTVIKI